MKSIYNIYERSLLDDDLDASLEQGDKDLDIMKIEKQLNNPDLYYIHNMEMGKSKYDIRKVGRNYIVDIPGNLIVFTGEQDNITDGSFSFGIVKGNYTISSSNDASDSAISLKYGPKSVGGDFEACEVSIKSLRYCPDVVCGDVSVTNTEITDLKYFPRIVNGKVWIMHNKKLNKLNNAAPCKIGRYATIRDNKIKTDYYTFYKDLKNWDIQDKRANSTDEGYK